MIDGDVSDRVTTNSSAPTPPDYWAAWEMAGVLAVGIIPYTTFQLLLLPLDVYGELLVHAIDGLCLLVAVVVFAIRGGWIGWVGMVAFLAFYRWAAALPRSRDLHFDYFDDVWTLATALAIIVATAAFISKNPGNWRAGGIVRPVWRVDLLLGLGIYVASELVSVPVVWINDAWNLQGIQDMSSAIPATWIGWQVLVLMALSNGVAEEFVLRGYLIPRLEKMTGSTALAIAISTLVFAGYHLYQGPLAAAAHLGFGAFCGIVFCRTRRLAPVVFAHFLGDLQPEHLFLSWLSAGSAG